MSCGRRTRTRRALAWTAQAQAVLLVASACATDRGRPYEDLMDEAVRDGEVPGVAVARIRGGAIELRVEGHADLARGEPVTEHTAFLWFSITKLFTAVAVLQLAERNAIGLDDPVVRYVPELPPVMAAVTVRHLLSHTSGVPNPLPIRWIHLEEEPAPDLAEMTFRLLREHPGLEHPPGERYAYSNLGYLVLGVLVERVTGRRFEEYVAEHILEPLAMRTTGFTRRGGATAAGYYRRYSFVGLGMRLMVDRKFHGPSVGRFGSFRAFLVDGPSYGGLVGSCADLARFVGALAGDGSFEGARILSPGSVAEMRSPQRAPGGGLLPVGLAWRFGSTDGSPDLRSTGGGGGYKTEVRMTPDGSRAVVVCANETTFDTGALAAAALRERGRP